MIDCAINRTRVFRLKPGSQQPNGRMIVVIACDKCPTEAEASAHPKLAPQAIADIFTRMDVPREADLST